MTAPPTSRWDVFTKPELHMIHHGLRVYCNHPLISPEDRELATRIANEAWDYHAQQVEASMSR